MMQSLSGHNSRSVLLTFEVPLNNCKNIVMIGILQ